LFAVFLMDVEHHKDAVTETVKDVGETFKENVSRDL
jgi:hypothetical protein